MRVLGIVLLLVGSIVAPSAALAATTPIPQSLSVQGPYGTTEVTVPIPSGTRPVRFTGRIESSFTPGGRFLLEVNDQVRDRVPLRGGRFAVRLRRADVRDGAVTIGMRVRMPPGRRCLLDDKSQAVIRKPRMVLNRKPPPPRTLADFLSPAARRFVVAVPRAPSTDEQAAGLDAVLALRHSFGPRTKITLRTTSDPPKTTPARHVAVVDEDGSGSSALAVRGGRLYVTGSPTELTKAAISLADPNVTLLGARNVTNLAGTADYAPSPATTTLQGLGVTGLRLRGIGTMSTSATIPQAAFGQPVSQLSLKLRGTVTPVTPGEQGRVNIRWNDQLLASQVVSDSSQVSVDFTVSGGGLLAVNTLTTQFQFLPDHGKCRRALAGEVQIDATASTVEATFGTGAPDGFQRFPQSFPAVIPVSFGLRAGPALRDAARLLDSAASASPLQYTVEIFDEPARKPGALITGATDTQAQRLGAPLPNQQDLASFAVGRSNLYAALQAFNSKGDDLIILSAEPPESARTLAKWPAAQPGGWADLEGQVYVASTSSGGPQAFTTPSSRQDSQRPRLILAVLVTAALLIGLLAWLGWRLKKR